MKRGLYLRMARTNLIKQKKLYVPYLLTGIGMIMVFYIVLCLSMDKEVKMIEGGDTITVILRLGVFVVGIFSTLFLFYISGYLTKQRKREFGLYNVLGMGKRHIARVMFYENALVTLICILGGTLLGVVFSKLSQLCLIRLMDAQAPLSFTINLTPILITLIMYLCAFGLVYINALRQLTKSNTIELLNASSSGEKPPKGNIFIALIGAVCLGIGYALALSVDNPVSSMVLFFVAVIFVILGTYALFISGSVAICKLLKRSKRYYYKAAHFVSVSGMAYRMKRNGAGLASICILSTMVLVVMSSVTCLFAGAEDSLRQAYPRDLALRTMSDDSAENVWLRKLADDKLAEYGYEPTNILWYRDMTFLLSVPDGKVIMHADDWDVITGGATQIHVMPLEDFNSMTGAGVELKKGEALIVFDKGDIKYDWTQIRFSDDIMYNVRVYEGASVQLFNGAIGDMGDKKLVVPDISDLYALRDLQNDVYSGSNRIQALYGFDLDVDKDAQIAFYEDLMGDVSESLSSNTGRLTLSAVSYALNRDEFYSIYAGLFFLGVVLGLTFAAASVLIMYYKQVTEGYEDQSRFTIMQHVGMSNAEIKKAINSQVLMVFFMPLAASVVHLLFAYPMVKLLLELFGLSNANLFMTITLISILAFSALYALVYIITSRAYYSIVSARSHAI